MIEVAIDQGHARARVAPEHGRPVTFDVRFRPIDVGVSRRNIQDRFVVGLLGSDGDGFAHFTKFETAVASMLSRANRYHRAYSKRPKRRVA